MAGMNIFASFTPVVMSKNCCC